MNLQSLKVPKQIPTEIDYLSHIWLGLNSPEVSQSQLAQLTNQLKFYPTSALKEAKVSTNLTGLREKLLSLKDARLFSAVLEKKYFPKTQKEKDINLSAELERINAPDDLKRKVAKLLGTEQTRCSSSAQVSNMSGVNTKSLSTERPQSSCSDRISDMSKVNKNKENTELLTDTEICALTDKQSIQQVIDHFRPAIRTVLQEIDMCPD